MQRNIYKDKGVILRFDQYNLVPVPFLLGYENETTNSD